MMRLSQFALNSRRFGAMINSLIAPLGVEVRRPIQPHYLRDLGIRTVLDVGANIGQFAGRARKILPEATIHSFEPLPQVYRELRRLAEHDHLMFVHETALGDADGETEMHENAFSPSSSLLPMTQAHVHAFPGTASTRSVRVPVTRLDAWASTRELLEPVMLKLDVQGYEDRVLTGGEMTLKRVRALIVETSFRELYQGQLLFDDLHSLLCRFGFRCAGFEDVSRDRDSGMTLQADALFLR
jgi:FkbM family methyltransferase